MRLDLAIKEVCRESVSDDIVALAIDRCRGTGTSQYVDDAGERWERVEVSALVNDVAEELADAIAYVTALVWRTGNRDYQTLIPLLRLCHRLLVEAERNPHQFE